MEDSPITLPVPDGFIEVVAHRVAELLKPDEREPFIGVREAAEHLACPRSRIYALAGCTPPRLPLHRDGSRLLFRVSELDAWVAEGGARRP